MKLRLPNKWIEHLCSLPESGMGYQIVEIILKNGKTLKKVIVLNGEEIVLPPEYKDLKLEDIKEVRLSEK